VNAILVSGNTLPAAEGKRTSMHVDTNKAGKKDSSIEPRARLKYEAPQLRRLGSLTDITMGSGAGSFDGFSGKTG
jgi:hypothetical protein